MGVAGYPAFHADFPRVETLGGPVLKQPNVVPVFFANDPMQGDVEQFLQTLSGSDYWSQTTGEYGAGGLRTLPSIVVSDPAPASITDAQIQSWLAGFLDGTHAEWPSVNNGNIYVVFFPSQTTIKTTTETSCVDFGGYHSEGALLAVMGVGTDPAEDDASGGNDDGGAPAADATSTDDATMDASNSTPGADAGTAGPTGASFTYAVIPRCATFNSLTGLDSVTAALSHELVETATDPFTRTRRAFRYVDSDHLAWAIGVARDPFGAEVADMCHSESTDRFSQRLLGSYIVERSWSNLAAGMNQDPCVPAGTGPYFGAAPDFQELEVISNDGGTPNSLLTTGVRVPVGQSKTVTLRLFSTAPMDDWYVSIRERLASAGAPTTLRTSLDKNHGHNGDIINLTITRVANGPTFDGTLLLVVSSAMPPPSQGPIPQANTWYGLVRN